MEKKTDIDEALDFVLSIDNLKQVRRRNPLVDGQRRERTAEHSWHVAVAAICLQEFAAEDIDLGQAVTLAVVHDLPEAVVGDTFVYGPAAESRRTREQAGMAMLLSRLPKPPSERLLAAWHEYEYEETPEGRYIMALDVMLPIFMNFAAGSQSSWCKYRVAAEDVRNRVAHVQVAIPDLADLAYRVINQAVEHGLLQ